MKNIDAEKYITTTLPYPNSKAHIGHTFEFVLADVIARFYREGEDVFFNVGIDEHGIKIQKTAFEKGVTPKEFCDSQADIWKEFCLKFQISYDNFYRTSSEDHKRKAKYFFDKYLFNKDFVKKEVYKGKYCEGCETFVTEKEIIEGNKCPIHFTELKEIEEENYFFYLSHFRNSITDNLVDKKLSNELKNISQSFDKISITRKNIDWAIDVGEGNTLYVWADALTNYIFAAGFLGSTDERENFESLWSESLIICGPDNLKFQAYILPAILAAAEITQPKEVLVHGNILDATGTKMSKTLGNVVDPIEQLEKWGVSPVRFYLFAGLNTFDSSSYSEEALVNLWNSEVVNNFGNLLSRLLHLIDIRGIKYPTFNISDEFNKELYVRTQHLDKLFTEYNFSEFKDTLFKNVSNLNKRINDEKPYAKESVDYERVLSEIWLEAVNYAHYYSLIIPEYKDILEKALEDDKKKISIFPRIEVNI
jgi:methionyl-tRNA synthetase